MSKTEAMRVVHHRACGAPMTFYVSIGIADIYTLLRQVHAMIAESLGAKKALNRNQKIAACMSLEQAEQRILLLGNIPDFVPDQDEEG